MKYPKSENLQRRRKFWIKVEIRIRSFTNALSGMTGKRPKNTDCSKPAISSVAWYLRKLTILLVKNRKSGFSTKPAMTNGTSRQPSSCRGKTNTKRCCKEPIPNWRLLKGNTTHLQSLKAYLNRFISLQCEAQRSRRFRRLVCRSIH